MTIQSLILGVFGETTNEEDMLLVGRPLIRRPDRRSLLSGRQRCTSHHQKEGHYESYQCKYLVHGKLLTLGTIELRGVSSGSRRTTGDFAGRVFRWIDSLKRCHSIRGRVGIMSTSIHGHHKRTSTRMTNRSNHSGELRRALAAVRACGVGDDLGDELFGHAGAGRIGSEDHASTSRFFTRASGHSDKSCGVSLGFRAFGVNLGGNNGNNAVTFGPRSLNVWIITSGSASGLLI